MRSLLHILQHCLAGILFLLALLPGVVSAAASEVTVAAFPAGFPYKAYTTKDGLGRDIRFYATPASDDRPLILVLQGSGCTSQFFNRDGQVSAGWHAFVRRAAGSRAQVLLVEKPGVELFDAPQNPGGAANCSDVFRREQTGERWLAALRAALDATISLRGAKPRNIMVLGHSEGAVFAVRLAAQDARVSHVASLSATPSSQLLDFFDMAAAGEGFISRRPGSNKAENIGRVLDAWRDVSADPASDSKQVFGHAHRYWADKFAPFDFSSLNKSPAKFFLAYGDRDENSAPRVMDAFAIELLTRKRDLTWLRVEGADHSFGGQPDPARTGMSKVVEFAVAWMFGEEFERKSVVWPRPAS
ncbi:MAG: alpha/beta fold hydrolase [Betaproteobacteria bacterium]|nr:alpha/beta fold hydrolase [Betaproteobacteria bacterium]